MSPLNAAEGASEVVTSAENWLSALRKAREQLGEQGGVPPGASCVMSATGEVTILDAASRRRFVLSRMSAPPEALGGPSARAGRPAASHASAAGVALTGGVRKSTPGDTMETSAAISTTSALPNAPSGPSADRSSLDALAESERATTTTTTAESADTRAQPSEAGARASTGSTVPLRKGVTMAYSPEESASAREQLLSAQAAAAVATTEPAPARASAASTRRAAPGRRATMAYSPEESARAREQLVAARASAQPPSAAGAGRKSTMAYSPEESAKLREQLVGAQSNGAPARAQPAAASAPGRKSTMAYSPEESAKLREQLVGAQPAHGPRGQSAPPSRPATHTPPEPGATEPVATRGTEATSTAPTRRATMAYMENPFAAASTAVVLLLSRDEEPSDASPITYRERCYFAPNGCDSVQARATLTQELMGFQRTLQGRGPGVLVNLALFDHYFTDRPERGPIASLEWKGWRGEPKFVFLADAPPTQSAAAPEAAPTLPSTPGEPVRTSFSPTPVSAPERPEVPIAKAPVLDAVPQAASAIETPKPVAQPAPAPSAAMATPAPHEPFRPREATGEQDRRLAHAFEAAQDLYFLGSAADGLDFGVKLLSELIACEAVAGCLYDINTNELRFVALTGPGAEERKAQGVSASTGILGAAAQSTEDVLSVPDVALDSRYDAAVDGRSGLEVRNMAVFPMRTGDTLLGVMQLINRERRAFTDGDLAVAAYVAKQVGEFLQSKRSTSRRR